MKKIGKNTKLYLIGMIIGGITLGITTVIADTIINSTSVAYKTTTVKAALDELYDIADFKQEVKDMLYPVGSIYISVSGTNPSQLFGGTWVSFGQGRTLLGLGSVESNSTNTYGSVSAGEWTMTVPETKGGEYFHTLTVHEMPQHRHGDLFYAGDNNFVKQIGGPTSDAWGIDIRMNTASKWGNSFYTGEQGENGAHNNMQPFITVYMWKRTA